ncbi:cation-translocating P-type ATPase [Embleya sp. NBC_00896]|uniref:cation-translocating P-type ATPase n=1 Tax=Embleya sp. NBC_00896 TaxID=2975961 RepID=UPI0038669AF6|nr:cation-transporting P-type ATPase [Embleya sp. NBC_00896]
MRDGPIAALPPRSATPSQGLTTGQASDRRAAFGSNTIERAPSVPVWARIAAQLRDPLVLVLLAAAVLTTVTGDVADTAIILVVVIFNTVVGVVQEIRADRAVTALSDLTTPAVRVLRDGVERELPSVDLVPGDVVLLEEGAVVPADALVSEASALLVDESSLTGESVPVDKSPIDPTGPTKTQNVLAAGTVVLRGRVVAEVIATGANSALGRIAALMRERPGPTPLQRRLARLGRVLALVVVVLCGVVFALGLLRGEPTEAMAISAISLAVAAVPESLPAVVTLGLALGARRMAARHAIVRNLPAVETLGSVTVLATDKTGTLTEGSMVAERLWTPSGTAELTGTGYAPTGRLRVGDRVAALDTVPHIRELLVAAALCNDATLVPPDADRAAWQALGDPTEAALVAAAGKAGLDRAALRERYPRVAEAPFDSGRRRMTTVHRAPGGGLRAVLKGAPEVVLTAEFVTADPNALRAARHAADVLAAEGYRVLALATRDLDEIPAHAESVERAMTLLGLIAIDDPPKAAAKETVAACRAAGITTVMITGDHPATAREIAVRLGIVDDRSATVLTGDDLAADPNLDLTRTRVFARTSPEQKLTIIQAWRARGAVTAMNGDGVNDGPALRRADIGVAMGRRGTEVARQAADVILADDEISTVVSAVEEGRRVYDNIRRFLVYALSGGTAEIAVMLIGPALGLPIPLVAAQILWINLLTHGLTGVALGTEPVGPGTMRRPPRPPEQSILGDGLWQRVGCLGAIVTGVTLAVGVWAEHTGRAWQTLLFLTLLAAQLGVVMGLRTRPFGRANPALPLAVLASAALGLAGVYTPWLRELLGTETLPAVELLLALAGALVGFLAARVARWAGSRARRAGDPPPPAAGERADRLARTGTSGPVAHAPDARG